MFKSVQGVSGISLGIFALSHQGSLSTIKSVVNNAFIVTNSKDKHS